MPKLPKSKPVQPLYTRGGTPIVDGFDPLGPVAPINTPFPTEVQNPNQLEPSQMRGAAGTVGIGRGRGNAGPARTGAFGYGIRSRSFEQYNAPITDPRRQEPGAPISDRPIVPIEGGDGRMRGAGANHNQGTSRGLDVRDISTPPASTGMRATSLGSPLASVGVRAASVGKSTASAAGRVTTTPAKAASASAPKPAAPAAATPTTSTKSTKKTGKSGSLLRR